MFGICIKCWDRENFKICSVDMCVYFKTLNNEEGFSPSQTRKGRGMSLNRIEDILLAQIDLAERKRITQCRKALKMLNREIWIKQKETIANVNFNRKNF